MYEHNLTTQRLIHEYSLNNAQKHCILYIHAVHTNGVYRLIHFVPHLIGIQITCWQQYRPGLKTVGYS
jgi:hypothetical protein